MHRRNFVCDGGDLLPPLLKVVVTVTTPFLSNFFMGCREARSKRYNCYTANLPLTIDPNVINKMVAIA